MSTNYLILIQEYSLSQFNEFDIYTQITESAVRKSALLWRRRSLSGKTGKTVEGKREGDNIEEVTQVSGVNDGK